jgi:hypothetical protein
MRSISFAEPPRSNLRPASKSPPRGPIEFDALRDLGVTLMQGYLLARPALSSLAMVEWPDRPQPIAQTA